MNIPNLPTDNLYKFMALTGAIIVMLTFTLNIIKADRTQEIHQELKKLGSLIDSELKNKELIILRLKNKSFKKNYKPDKAISNYEAETTKLMVELKLLLEQKNTYLAIFIVVGGFGLILSIFGFRLWYLRVQQYQDIILKNNALSKNDS